MADAFKRARRDGWDWSWGGQTASNKTARTRLRRVLRKAVSEIFAEGPLSEEEAREAIAAGVLDMAKQGEHVKLAADCPDDQVVVWCQGLQVQHARDADGSVIVWGPDLLGVLRRMDPDVWAAKAKGEA